MRLSNHLIRQANEKKIPMVVIQQIIDEKVSLLKADIKSRDNICRDCGSVKKGYSNITPIVINGVSYSAKVVVCVRCDLAITVFSDELLKGNTPIHQYQWDKGMRTYSPKCPTCRKSFHITSRNLDECVRQTTHTCNGTIRHLMEGI